MATYGKAAKVIRRLDITKQEDKNRLRELAVKATEWADTKLKLYVAVPLSSVPERVKHLCEERMQIKFRMEKAPTPEAAGSLKTLLDVVEEDMDKFIESEYAESSAIAFVVGTADQ